MERGEIRNSSESTKGDEFDLRGLCHDLLYLSPDEIDNKYFVARDIDKLDFSLKEHQEIKAKAEQSGLILVDKSTFEEAKTFIQLAERISVFL